jgi:competence protein ComEC
VKKNPLRFLPIALLLALVLGLSVWRYISIPAPVRQYDGRTWELTMEAAGFTGDAPYGKQVAVRLNGVSGTLYYTGKQDFEPGDILSGPFRITLTPRSGSHFKAATYQEIAVEEGSPRLRDRPVIWAKAVKDRIASLYSGDSAALLTGILTGDRSSFTDALTGDLFSTGMTHVAAVSGMHVSILAGFIVLVARSRRRSFFISLPMIFLYVAITGFTPSAVRAGIMITIFTVAPLLGREYHSLRALVTAFLILCVLNPYAVFEPAMQLSFSATLGLILFAGKWQRALEIRFSKPPVPKRAARFIASSLSASCAALVFSMPFAAYWFGGASLLAPLSNLLLLWLVNIIFIGGALSLAFPFLTPVAGAALVLFRAVLAPLAKIPYAVLYTAQPYLLAWLLYAYAMFVILVLTRRWKAPLLLTVSALAVCLSLTVWRDSRFRLEITALDVGQGQCIVIRSGGQTAIYDCGGSANAGRVAAQFLQSRGIRGTDALILSHYDNDHINGVPALASLVDVPVIYGPEAETMPDAFPVERVGQGQTFTLGEAEITLIPSGWFGDDNALSLSILVTLDGFSFLATGDMGHPSERWLLRQTGLRHADVIMAGHHGSSGSTSAELLDALAPQATVISVGINNSYGHPSRETMQRLLERDIAVYRTDRRGHVIIRV